MLPFRNSKFAITMNSIHFYCTPRIMNIMLVIRGNNDIYPVQTDKSTLQCKCHVFILYYFSNKNTNLSKIHFNKYRST